MIAFVAIAAQAQNDPVSERIRVYLQQLDQAFADAEAARECDDCQLWEGSHNLLDPGGQIGAVFVEEAYGSPLKRTEHWVTWDGPPSSQYVLPGAPFAVEQVDNDALWTDFLESLPADYGYTKMQIEYKLLTPGTFFYLTNFPLGTYTVFEVDQTVTGEPEALAPPGFAKPHIDGWLVREHVGTAWIDHWTFREQFKFKASDANPNGLETIQLHVIPQPAFNSPKEYYAWAGTQGAKRFAVVKRVEEAGPVGQ